MEVILKIENLSKSYGQGEKATLAVRDLSLDVLSGEFLGIMGASGSGKTTLMNCVATMIRPSSGRILFDGIDLAAFSDKDLAEYRGNRIGYLFQHFNLLENLTARENIFLPLALHGIKANEGEAQVQRVANLLGIQELLDKFPSQISGGQAQRVAAARALVSDPDLILADEPTGALDSKNSKNLMDRFRLIHEKEAKTIMMVTHNAQVASYCTRILFIQDGQIFHELRRKINEESQEQFYQRIVALLAQMGGGSAHVL